MSFVASATPFLVVAAWWANQRLMSTDTTAADTEPMLWRRAQLASGGPGLTAVVLGPALFAWPHRLMAVWPWPLTALTARVVASICVLGGAGMGIARRPSWASARMLFQVLWVMLGLILVAIVRAWPEFDRAGVATWAFLLADRGAGRLRRALRHDGRPPRNDGGPQWGR